MSEPLSAKEYLTNKRREIDENELKVEKCTSKFKKITCIWGLSVLALVGLSLLVGNGVLSYQYNRYMSGNGSDEQLTSELIEYKDAYAKFETDKLGNKGNSIMNYGLVCKGDGFLAYEKVENNNHTLVLQMNDVEKVISYEDVEYINTDNQFIYYVKKSDNSVYKNDFEGNEQQLASDLSVGEMLLYNGTLYFINNNDNCSIYSLGVDGNTIPEKVVEDNVIKFAISGSNIIYLNEKNDVCKYDFDSDSISKIQSMVEDFCYNGSIIALNNNKLISFKSSGKDAKVLLEGKVSLLNSDGEYIYYSKANELYCYEIISGEETKLLEGYEVYKAVYKIDSKLFCYVFNKNTDEIYEESLVIEDI